MAVGLGRFSIPRDGSNPRSGPSNRGLVVEAVLVMALVTTIGIFVIASRVAGSRQSASSSSLSLAARQAAEFGFTEVIAEMNRDPKSYLWVTRFEEWNNVSAQDLKDCGVAATAADPVTSPISSLGSVRALPKSPELFYRFVSYKEPANPDEDLTASAGCNSKFGNLIGGTGEITIEGILNRGSGYTSTFTLKRKVSVKRAAPIFNNPITAIPSPSIRTFDAADSRFPPFPVAPTGTPYEISCAPEGSSKVIKCTAKPDSLPGSLTATFKSGTASATEKVNDSTGLEVDYFPYIYTSGLPWSDPGPCQQDGANVRCLVKSMTVKANTNMLVATKKGTTEAPVEIFLSENMIIEPLAKLSGEDSGDGKGWSRFRIFGVTTGTSCGSQTITINPYLNTPTPATIPPTFNETNLQNAFLWLNKGKLKYETSTSLTRIPALVGSVCKFESAVAGPATLSTLSNRRFLQGLGGAYGFSGLFGAPTPIRFFYRGFGFEDERISS